MAIENRPEDVIDWARLSAGDSNSVMPDLSAQNAGWAPAPAKPIRTWLNYWMRGVYRWVRWMDRATAKQGRLQPLDPSEVGLFIADEPSSELAMMIQSPSRFSGGGLRLQFLDYTQGDPVLTGHETTINPATGLAEVGPVLFQLPLRKATALERVGTLDTVVATPAAVRDSVAYSAVQEAGKNGHGPTGGWTVTGVGAVGGDPCLVYEEWGTASIVINEGDSGGFAGIPLSSKYVDLLGGTDDAQVFVSTELGQSFVSASVNRSSNAVLVTVTLHEPAVEEYTTLVHFSLKAIIDAP